MLQCTTNVVEQYPNKEQQRAPLVSHASGRSHSVDIPAKSDPSIEAELDEAGLGLPRSRSAPSLASLDGESSFICVHSPKPESVWKWGQSAFLMWERRDASISEVRIVLRRKGASASTLVADHVENNGLFVYQAVPAGITPANDYYIRIMSMDGTQVADSGCFSIVA
ncbi:hypothetical protein AeMF1_014111 [Aphanomyces euteiches]|nr:hypothetical protein AeMF1_014111 [Aphanomyces euteiches]